MEKGLVPRSTSMETLISLFEGKKSKKSLITIPESKRCDESTLELHTLKKK